MAVDDDGNAVADEKEETCDATDPGHNVDVAEEDLSMKQSFWNPQHVVDDYALKCEVEYTRVIVPFVRQVCIEDIPTTFYVVVPRVDDRLAPDDAFAIATAPDEPASLVCGLTRLQNDTDIGTTVYTPTPAHHLRLLLSVHVRFRCPNARPRPRVPGDCVK